MGWELFFPFILCVVESCMVVQSEEDYIYGENISIEVGVKKKLRMQLIYSNRDIFVKITKK